MAISESEAAVIAGQLQYAKKVFEQEEIHLNDLLALQESVGLPVTTFQEYEEVIIARIAARSNRNNIPTMQDTIPVKTKDPDERAQESVQLAKVLPFYIPKQNTQRAAQ